MVAWTELPRFIGITEPDCDNAAHGFECRCLAGRDEQGNVIDAALLKLTDELQAAEEEVESAEDEVEHAEDRLHDAEREVDRRRKAITDYKRPVAPGQVAA